MGPRSRNRGEHQTTGATSAMNLIQRLRERSQQADADLKQKQADSERRSIEALQLQKTAERLQQEVDRAERQLAVATQQYEQFKTQRADLCEVLRKAWGLTHADGSAEN